MAAAIPVIIAAVVAAGAAVYSGYQSKQASKREAGLMEDQAKIARAEAEAAAQRRADQIRSLSKRQALAFMKNGVSLTGSPLLTIDNTVTKGQEEVNAIAKRGDSQATLFNARAAMLKNAGRADFLGGLITGAASAAQSYSKSKNSGLGPTGGTQATGSTGGSGGGSGSSTSGDMGLGAT